MPNLLRWLVLTLPAADGLLLAIVIAWPLWGAWTDYGQLRAAIVIGGGDGAA